jgi:hypothetical protein
MVAPDLIGTPAGLSALNGELESLLGDAHARWNWFVDSCWASALRGSPLSGCRGVSMCKCRAIAAATRCSL